LEETHPNDESNISIAEIQRTYVEDWRITSKQAILEHNKRQK